MLLSFLRPKWAVRLGFAMLALSAHGQTSSSLRSAVEAAWALGPQAQSLTNRQAELDARSQAASSLIAGPPSISLSHRSDRPAKNGGLRESEAALAFPIWSPGVRSATSAAVQADRQAFDQELVMAKIRLAAEVRDLAAQAALARNEALVAQRKQQEAALLARDVERRVKAGEVARLDLLQAQAFQRQAAAVEAQAESATARVAGQWRALTGLADIAELDEATGAVRESPAILAADSRLRAAQARLALTEKDRRDPIEVGVGVTRERPAFGAASDTAFKVTLRVPLGTYGRNAPRLAAARAELDAAQADALSVARTVKADQESAGTELEAARRAELLAAERSRLSTEAQTLIVKSYRLGESDLPTRLRTDNERFDAELAHARARVETRRAISKLNQAFGILP
ncbi:MAG: TolC family protein [Pseudomonadota bacterium]